MSKLITSQITELIKLITEGIANWIRAGEIIEEIIKSNENGFDLIIEKTGYSPVLITALRRMANKTLYPYLMLKSGLGYKKLEKCSYDDQVKYCNEPVDLLITTDDGFDTLKVSVNNLTNNQINQIYNGSEIRDLAAQRAYIESANTYGKIKEVDLDYLIEGKNLVVLNKTKFSKRQLIKIIDSM